MPTLTMSLSISDWRPVRRGALVGFIDAHLPTLTLRGCSVFESNSRRWALPAGKPTLDKNGIAQRDHAGKLIYQPVVSFPTKAVHDAFSQAVIAALLAAHPDAFGEPESASW